MHACAFFRHDVVVMVMDNYHAPDQSMECSRSVAHPEYWSRDDVGRWLRLCADEYDLSIDLADRFIMNGLRTFVWLVSSIRGRTGPPGTYRVGRLIRRPRWAAKSNVEVGQTTHFVNRGRVGMEVREESEGQSHRDKEREGRREWNRGGGPGMYLS